MFVEPVSLVTFNLQKFFGKRPANLRKKQGDHNVALCFQSSITRTTGTRLCSFPASPRAAHRAALPRTRSAGKGGGRRSHAASNGEPCQGSGVSNTGPYREVAERWVQNMERTGMYCEKNMKDIQYITYIYILCPIWQSGGLGRWKAARLIHPKVRVYPYLLSAMSSRLRRLQINFLHRRQVSKLQ